MAFSCGSLLTRAGLRGTGKPPVSRRPHSGARSISSCLAPRIGHGFDLHRLEPDLPLILGGVTLPHDRGCAGHSDGDAVYHCVVDAILGAMSMPDIGQLFPDKDLKWKGAPSDVFMRAAREIMEENGYCIGNVDVTVILERPKLAPHKEQMRRNIADLLGTDLENINVKAKTHEKVDAVGENRAVSCHTVAILTRVSGPKSHSTESSTTKMTDSAITSLGQRISSVMGMVSDANTSLETDHILERLYQTVQSRRGGDPDTSWTSKLFSKGRAKIGQKTGEEALETVIAAIQGSRSECIKESADLLYHLMVLWADMDISPKEVWSELQSRENQSGLEEKRMRKE